MERKKRGKNGGLYLAICSCLVIVAMVGYAGRISLKESEEDMKTPIVEVPPETEIKQTTQKAEVIVAEDNEQGEQEEVQEEKTDAEVIEFYAPVSGKVIEEYLGDDLVYSEALRDWRTHKGVDFAAEMGEDVKTSAPGVVERVFDSGLGRCVIVDHRNGFSTMYANLEEDTLVKEGDEVKAGDVIGKVGNTALGDITDLPHVHFEMMKEGNSVNPAEFLN